MRGPGLVFLLTFFISAAPLVRGQNLLNSGEADILKYVKKNHPEMVLDKNFKNDHYRYLKFIDGNQESWTMLFFMSEDNRCTAVRMIYAPEMKKQVIENLNNSFRYVGDNLWIDSKSKHEASIEMKIEDWFLTVTLTPVKSE